MQLTSEFYNRNTVTVAKDLIGKYLNRRIGRRTLSAMIIETEAYHGTEDRASHARAGITNRTRVMFGAPGFLYIYLVYGIHHCLNISTMRDGFPGAVLIRAVACENGMGPGRLCKLFQINRALNGTSACTDAVWIEDRGTRIPRGTIEATRRIGVEYAGVWAEKPWRFTLH